MTDAGVEALEGRPILDTLPLGAWRIRSAAEADRPIEAGIPWPAGWSSATFERPTATVPAEWPLADVRLDLDVGADAVVTLHSRWGIERHAIAAGGSALPVPARAFGLRIEATGGSGATVGTTRLVVLGPPTASRHRAS